MNDEQVNEGPALPPASSSSLNSEQRREIANWVSGGLGLSDIQKRIAGDYGVVMTYMDVRFLVDDLDLDLVDPEQPEAESSKVDDIVVEDEKVTSGVSVEVDGVTPPGAMASGSVTFSDGESKNWTLDQFGRLAMSGGTDGYQPSEKDVMEFQRSLEKALRGPSL